MLPWDTQSWLSKKSEWLCVDLSVYCRDVPIPWPLCLRAQKALSHTQIHCFIKPGYCGHVLFSELYIWYNSEQTTKWKTVVFSTLAGNVPFMHLDIKRFLWAPWVWFHQLNKARPVYWQYAGLANWSDLKQDFHDTALNTEPPPHPYFYFIVIIYD